MERKEIKGLALKDVSMKRYTSMKVGGQAKYLIYPSDEADLSISLQRTREEGIPYRFLGNGTNIIVSDAGVDAALFRITRMRHLRFTKAGEGVMAHVSGGMPLRVFIRECARRGLSGLEKLYWIPGTVGGGIKMNAGSFGQSISDTLVEMTIVDAAGSLLTILKEEQAFGYRTSPVKVTDCVVSARFALTKKDKKEIAADMDYVCNERKKRHPMEYPSAGSVFKSAGNEPAWRLIDRAGLRGFSIGGAQVSEKHPNFIINLGYAKARDIKDLIDRIKKEVYEKLGVFLAEEVELWGFNG